MIDELEPTRPTRIATIAVLPVTVGYSLLGSFTAPEDITLRQVLFMTDGNGTMDMVLSTDQSFEAVGTGETHEEFQLYSGTPFNGSSKGVGFSVSNLAFPLLKGSKIFAGFGPLSSGAQLIVLIFT